MVKTILITGSTDGIGFEAAKKLVSEGHTVLLHGRNVQKLGRAVSELSALGAGAVDGFAADLSVLAEIPVLIDSIAAKHPTLDVVINNAGVFKTSQPLLESGLDARFVVNTIAPYLLTKLLLQSLPSSARIINLSSAAQAPVDLAALLGKSRLDDSAAYAQSKLALTAWSHVLGQSLGEAGPLLVAINPGSFLATKMVKEAYGSSGKDISVGVNILYRASLEEPFASANGLYFDNDRGQFAQPHPEALDAQKNVTLIDAIESLIHDQDISTP